MKFDDKLIKQISEAKYLAQENSYRYRPIMRYFYQEYEKTKYWIYKEEVYEVLKDYIPSSDYTLLECEHDLEALVGWQSLTKMQDTSNVPTIQEFNERRVRYQITDYAIEIEHLAIELENLEVKTSSLEPKIFERIKNKLKSLEKLKEMSDTDLNELWHDLNNDFIALNQNYQSFLKKFNEVKSEELLHSIDFLDFKSQMIQYLKNFIQGYQSNLHMIQKILINFSADDINYLMNTLVNYEKKAPKMRPAFDFEHFRNVNYGKWVNIYKWFVSNDNHGSEGERMMTSTSNIIVKITKYASSLIELRGNMTSRKEEYKHICKLFDQQPHIQDCHRLSSVIFGIDKVKHFTGYSNITTDSIVSTYDIPPIEIPLEVRNKVRKEKTYAMPIEDKTWKKEKMLKQYRQEQEKNQQLLKKLVTNKKIELKGDIHLTKLERDYILNLISKDGFVKETEFGYQYEIVPYHDDCKCVIHSEDGTFEMKGIQINFEGVINE